MSAGVPPETPPRAQPPRAQPPRPEAPHGSPWRSRARRVLPYFVVGGAGFLLAYLVVYLFVFPSRLVPNDRPVPNVVGMLQVDAERALRDAGFQPQQGERRVNASVPPETVVAQTPPATTMKPPNTTVIIDIAASP
ncbi:PASTA domain containing protein [Gemmatirosa kalamazoonensis]|uniref:PASTA domain containing protein n=1 Tax=Gemmatirosa kalamazoonensis TaxID=861299 RepID=W0RH34_9BACT|nr:PASTA domain-containing protein [Gemmatirosa kalamazoonensis]AHG90101.1 PASTA domain containing protein [Gemmatirosa kalamazoonensis]